MFCLYEVLQQVVELGLEDGLQTPKDEVTARRRVDKEAESMRHQEFGQRVALDTCEHCAPSRTTVGPRPGEAHASREVMASHLYEATLPGPTEPGSAVI